MKIQPTYFSDLAFFCIHLMRYDTAQNGASPLVLNHKGNYDNIKRGGTNMIKSVKNKAFILCKDTS